MKIEIVISMVVSLIYLMWNEFYIAIHCKFATACRSCGLFNNHRFELGIALLALGISTGQKIVDLKGYFHNATYDLTESIVKSLQSKLLWALAIPTACRACSPLPTGSLFISVAWVLKEIFIWSILLLCYCVARGCFVLYWTTIQYTMQQCHD